MKRILLSILIIGLLLFVACGAPPTGAPTEDEVDRLKDEVAELRAELNELQSSYDTLLSQYKKLQAETIVALEQPETPPPETRTEKLPYSWTEDDFLITIHEVFKASLGENWEDYRVRISYKNTLKRTTKADIEIGYLKLKTDAGNLYDPKSSGGTSYYESFAPEQSQETISYSFRVRKTEKPTELWFYEHGWYAEEPNIIFELSEPTLIAKIGDTIPDCAGKQGLSLTLLWWEENKIAVYGPYVDGYYTFTAKPGMKFIILAYEFRNNGTEEQTTPYLSVGEIVTAPEGHYEIFDPPAGVHSEEYKPRKATAEEIDALIGNSGGFEHLLPGESVQGRVVFEIPENMTPVEAKIASVPYIIEF